MSEEVWKDIEGYEGRYQVSNLGRVKGLERYDSRGHLTHNIISSILIILGEEKR